MSIDVPAPTLCSILRVKSVGGLVFVLVFSLVCGLGPLIVGAYLLHRLQGYDYLTIVLLGGPPLAVVLLLLLAIITGELRTRTYLRASPTELVILTSTRTDSTTVRIPAGEIVSVTAEKPDPEFTKPALIIRRARYDAPMILLQSLPAAELLQVTGLLQAALAVS